MLKKYHKWLTLVSMAAFATVLTCSCDDDKEEEPPVPPVTPVTVSLAAADATTTTLSFTITASENAEQVAYTCIPVIQTPPDAAALFKTGTVAAPAATPFVVENLESDFAYKIVAAARAGESYSDVRTLDMRTLEVPIEYTKLTATSSMGSAYYGNVITKEKGTGQYHLYLTNMPHDDQGVITGAGRLFQISLHAAPSEDPNNAQLPAGIYTQATDMAAGTSDISWSQWRTSDEAGNVSERGFFTHVEAEVEVNAGTYHIVLRTTDELGDSFETTYDGPITWRNMIPGGKAGHAQAWYYGKDKDSHPDTDRWVMQISDYPVGGGQDTWMIQSEFYAPICDDYKNPTIPTGTYTVKPFGTMEAYTVSAGVKGSTPSLNIGTFFNSLYSNLFLSDGTMVVSEDGGQYTIECVMSDPEGNTAEVNFTGTFEVVNRYTPEITTDMDITLNQVCGAKYYGMDRYVNEVHNYMICLADKAMSSWNNPKPLEEGEANYMMLYFHSKSIPTTTDIRLPEGTYTLSDDAADFICDSYDCELRHWDEDGTKYLSYFEEGNIIVEHTDTGYKIEASFVDSNGKTIHAVYEGAVAFDNASGNPLPYPSRRAQNNTVELPVMHPAVGQVAFMNLLSDAIR